MNVENDHLAALRNSTSKALLAVLWLHVPIAITIAMARDNGWMMPTLLTVAMALAATLSWQATADGLSTRLVFAVALMADVATFTYQLSGHPWQTDAHMYFFAALACLVAFCDYRPIIAGTVAVALHHLVLNFVLPSALYPGGSDFGRVVLHAVILLIEAGVLIWLALTLSKLFETAAQKSAEAQDASAAGDRANADRLEAERRANPQAKRELLVDRDDEVHVRHDVDAAGIAAGAAQRLAQRMLRRAVIELDRRRDEVDAQDDLRRRDFRHARRIAPHGARVFRGGRAAGVRIAEPADALFLQRKRRAERLSRT